MDEDIEMVLNIDVAGRFLGRNIFDLYGMTVGKIVGISTDVRGMVTSLELELANGQFLNCPGEQIEISGDHAVFLDDWRIQSKTLKVEMDISLKRIKALSDLHRRGEIQPEIYEDLRKQHDANLGDLQKRKDALVKNLSIISNGMDGQLRRLEMFLANNKMQLASGEIDGQSYKVAVDALERGLRRALSGKKDVETLLGNLRTLKLGPDELGPAQDILVLRQDSNGYQDHIGAILKESSQTG